MIFTLLQYYTLIFIQNIRERMSFHCCYESNYVTITKITFFQKKRLARISHIVLDSFQFEYKMKGIQRDKCQERKIIHIKIQGTLTIQ